MSNEMHQPEGQMPAPEPFPPELLAQPVEARLEYFEQRCLISHPRLQEALETIIQAICPPGEGANTRRPGTMLLVIGPSRVGKTTLIRLLEEQLLLIPIRHLKDNPQMREKGHRCNAIGIFGKLI
jgi:hypothetical protein